MPVKNPTLIEILDEGISQGFVTSVDFTGTGVVATAAGFQGTVNVSGGGSGGSATTVEVDLGDPAWMGKFTIIDAAIGPTNKILGWQAPGPYTGKGSLADEAVMQPVKVTVIEALSGSAIVHWETPQVVTYHKIPTGEPLISVSSVNPKDIYNRVFGPATRIGKIQGNVKFSYMVLN